MRMVWAYILTRARLVQKINMVGHMLILPWLLLLVLFYFRYISSMRMVWAYCICQDGQEKILRLLLLVLLVCSFWTISMVSYVWSFRISILFCLVLPYNHSLFCALLEQG